MLLERAVAGFAVHDGMLANGLSLHDIVVTFGARLVSGKSHGSCRYLFECVGPVVSVESEALGDEMGAYE